MPDGALRPPTSGSNAGAAGAAAPAGRVAAAGQPPRPPTPCRTLPGVTCLPTQAKAKTRARSADPAPFFRAPPHAAGGPKMRAAYLFAHLFENQESSMKPSEGHITYIEFPAPSRESLHAARAFYGQAFGWMYQPWGDDSMDTAGSGIGSGMTCDHPPCKPLAVIYTADLEVICCIRSARPLSKPCSGRLPTAIGRKTAIICTARNVCAKSIAASVF